MARAGDELGVRHPCLNTAAEPVSGGVLFGVACLDHRHRPSAGGASGQICTACRSTLLLRIRGGKGLEHSRMTARLRVGMNAGNGLTMRVSRACPCCDAAMQTVEINDYLANAAW